MGQLVAITRNQEQLRGFQIETSLDMHTVLDWGKVRGYSGHLNLDSQGVWTLGLTAPGGSSTQTAWLQDWVVITNDTIAELVPVAQAGNLFTITGPV